MIPSMQFIPRRPGTVATPSLFHTSGNAHTAPSGATPTQIRDLQGALVALRHAEPIAITGRMPIGTPAQISAFQRNYNAENACRRNPSGAGCRPPYSNNGFQPATLAVDGDWGRNTEAALTNYVSWSRQELLRRGIGATTFSENAPGVSMTPLGPSAPGAPSKAPMAGGATDGKGDAAIQPAWQPAQQSTPRALPAPVAPQAGAAPVGPAASANTSASSFPVGPAIAVGVGVVALVGAIVWKSQQGTSVSSPSRRFATRSKR